MLAAALYTSRAWRSCLVPGDPHHGPWDLTSACKRANLTLPYSTDTAIARQYMLFEALPVARATFRKHLQASGVP